MIDVGELGSVNEINLENISVTGEAIQNNGQAAVSFEILKKQVEAISHIAKSQNSKTVILPTDITKVLGSFETVLETIKNK